MQSSLEVIEKTEAKSKSFLNQDNLRHSDIGFLEAD